MRLQNSTRSLSASFALFAATAGAALSNVPAAGAAQESNDRPRALLYVAAEPPRIVFSDVKRSGAPAPEAGSYARYLETQRALIKSRVVLEAALRSGAREAAISQLASIKNRKNPIAWVEQNLEVTNLKDTQLLQVAIRLASDCRIEDQAPLINAVVESYVRAVVNEERDRRSERLQSLRKISEKYSDILHERRQVLRALRSNLGNDEAIIKPEKEALSRLMYDLLKQRVQLSLDRAEAETLLDRRKQAANPAAEPVRKEIDVLQERLAVVTARGKALDKELVKVREQLRSQPSSLDLETLKQEIVQLESASQKIFAEIESLNVELNSPARIRVIEYAALPKK
jgi:hypothetical protein